MRIFEKIKSNMGKGSCETTFCFGKPLTQTISVQDNKKKWIKKKRKLFLEENGFYEPKHPDAPVFYLKVNREDDYSFQCLQRWVYIAEQMGCDFIIQCDRMELQKKILQRIRFVDSEVYFMRSYISPFKKLIDKITSSYWHKAGYAHASTFYHAQKYSIDNFWNIDADDTMLMLSIRDSIEVLRAAMDYAHKNEIDAFSLDMHATRTRNVTWTFGVTYTQMNKDWFKLFNKYSDESWKKNYTRYFSDTTNLDLYMSYLRDIGQISVKSFWVNNLTFIHYAYLLTPFMIYAIYNWRDNKLFLPLSKLSYDNEISIEMPEDCIELVLDGNGLYKENVDEVMRNVFFNEPFLIRNVNKFI